MKKNVKKELKKQIKKHITGITLFFAVLFLIIGAVIGFVAYMVLNEEASTKIELNGAEVVNLNIGDEYTDLGATFIIDGVDYKAEVVVEGSVDTNKEGIYVVTYTLKNNAVDIVLKRLVNVGGVSYGE